MSLNSDDFDDDNISILKDGLDLQDVTSEKGGTFCVTNISDDKNDENILTVPYEALMRNELFKDDEDILGLGFDEISHRFESLTADNEIKKLIVKEGVGGIITDDANYSTHYDCFLEYADEPIDSSRCRKKPMNFKLGHFETIEGFEIAVRSMRKKENSAFLISPKYAFGEYGCPPRIPANATLLYLIELLSFENNQDEYYSLSQSERVKAPLEVMKKIALKLHKKGKDLYKEKKFLQANRTYHKELDILESHHLKDEEEENDVKEILKNLYENLSLCNLKILNSGKCITYANLAMGIKGETPKLLYCKGKALRQLGQFAQAKKLLERALQILPKNDPNSKDINLEINKLEKKWNSISVFLTDAYCDMKISDPSILSFYEMFEQNIKIFKSDKDLIELPISCKLYSNDKLTMMKEIIIKYNLNFKEYINEDGEKELHILKSSADLIDNQQLLI